MPHPGLQPIPSESELAGLPSVSGITLQAACRVLPKAIASRPVRYSLMVGCVSLVLLSSRAFAQAPQNPATLDGLWKAIGSENYAEAKRQADALLPTVKPEDRLKVSLAYGRILLGLKLKEPARQYLTMMSKQPLDGDAQALLEVYGFWLEALDGKADAAIRKLEAKLGANSRSLQTCEAADVLAMLYMVGDRDQGTGDRGAGNRSQGVRNHGALDRAKDKERAQKAVDFGLGVLNYLSLLGKTDYIEALLRGRLQSNIASPEAERLYNEAEKLREEGKFTEAARIYQQILEEHPKTEWIHPARFRQGHCLLGVNRPQEAYKHWKKFLDEDPTGPWRGQTHVAIIDLALDATST